MLKNLVRCALEDPDFVHSKALQGSSCDDSLNKDSQLQLNESELDVMREMREILM